mmetsp:Transcript_18506/g.38012  ORF Transcript_18506/g.38012 Transcript_18506/m.38012 type:complete len:394 (-) Transcript_18506:259-1440(-)
MHSYEPLIIFQEIIWHVCSSKISTMALRKFGTTIILSTVCLGTTAAAEFAGHNKIVSWIRLKGGSFSEKLEIRRVDPADPTSYWGIFAKENIAAKEDLFNIPTECYIHIFDIAEDMNVEEDDEPYLKNACKLAHKLKEEMKLGEKSDYAPYIEYLKTQRPGQLPSNWSKEGKDVLRKVEPDNEIVDWIDLNFKEKNCIGNDPFEEHMVEMTIQRGYDTAFIPIWDMVNHDNGRTNTENDTMYRKDGLKVRASRNIKAGEELFTTYDSCVDCYDDYQWEGTFDILKDFGFVESYPRRWIFEDQEIWFQIDEDKDGELVVDFGEKETSLHVDQILFLKNELDRLQEVDAFVLQNQKTVPAKEWRTILQYHDAAVHDIDAVIKKVTYAHSNSNADA